MITIEARDKLGALLAAASHHEEAMLCLDRVYQPGDHLIIRGEKRLFARMDQCLPACEVFCPEGELTWPIPSGEHRLAYAPGSFEAPRHVITARALREDEIDEYRDLALDPADLRGDTNFYPHCTANVETRNEACFCARNVIDGTRFNTYHGEWPFQSWGIGAREDARCLLDFGREVTIDKMALTLRADFPHDAYWVSGHVVLSDGADIGFPLEKTGERQWIPLGEHSVRWMRLERMVKSDDPSAFPALTEWEVFGRG